MWPLNLNFMGTATIVAGMVVAVGAAGAWMREDGIHDCNAAWELRLAKANESIVRDLAIKQQKLEELQRILAATEAEAARLNGENNDLLAKQRSSVPLSSACLACRIPNERLWLRSRQPATPAKGS